MTWGKFILAAWGVVLGYSALLSSLPASWWFEAGEARVEDAVRGECPSMTFSRDINRTFHAEWTVTIMRQSAGGAWVTFRTHPGANDYRPENGLPDDLNLCWWIWKEGIDLPPGRYRVHTLWRINPTKGRAREVRRTSNPFTISPAKE